LFCNFENIYIVRLQQKSTKANKSKAQNAWLYFLCWQPKPARTFLPVCGRPNYNFIIIWFIHLIILINANMSCPCKLLGTFFMFGLSILSRESQQHQTWYLAASMSNVIGHFCDKNKYDLDFYWCGIFRYHWWTTSDQ